MNTNISYKVQLSRILESGKIYFSAVDELSSCLGDDRKSRDAAEVLLLLHGARFLGYFDRTRISELLCLSKRNVDRAVDFLKKKNLVYPYKKGIKLTGNTFSDCDEDTMFRYYVAVQGLDDWYLDMERHWVFLTYLHVVQEWIGLRTPLPTRRFLARCLCMDCICQCSKHTLMNLKKDILELRVEELEQKIGEDRYREDVISTFETRINKNKSLGLYQKAKLIILNPEFWDNGKLPNNVPKKSFEIAKKALSLFDGDIDTSIKYIYQYFVRQPFSDDCDFPYKSKFYGKSLEERLVLLEDRRNIW